MACWPILTSISTEELGQQWQRWGERVGFPQSLEEENAFWRGFWAHLNERLALPQAVHEELQQFDYTRFLRPFPDARPALEYVQQQGIPVAVLSNFSLASLEDSLGALGLLDLVDVACAAPVIGASKPEPAAYQAVTEALRVDPDRCLFFDDEPPCVAGAEQMGMQAFLVDRDRRQHNLAAHVVCDLSAVFDIL